MQNQVDEHRANLLLDVAEKRGHRTATKGAAIGAALGSFLGPVGAMAGAGVGYAIGKMKDAEEAEEVDYD